MGITPNHKRVFGDSITVRSLGLGVTPGTVSDVVRYIDRVSSRQQVAVIAAHNLHSVYIYHTNKEFKRFCEAADILLVDGWPVLAALNRQGREVGQEPYSSDYRIGSTDWIPRAIKHPSIRRVCVLGATEESNSQFIERQKDANADVSFLGIPGNPWDMNSLSNSIDSIQRFSPDLIIIGMGMPLQETIAWHLQRSLSRGIIATVGGAIDQISGVQVLAPRWTGRLKMEWAWRLASNPRRLAYRYLVEPVKLWNILRKRKK